MFCSRFFVTLQEFAGFLYTKAVQRIEKNWGYDLETVLDSMFCYKLPKRAPDSKPPPVSWLIVDAKVQLYFETTKCYSQNLTFRFIVILIVFIILQYLREQHHVFQWGRVAKHEFAIAGYVVVGSQETEVIDGIDVLWILDDLL